MTSQQPVRFAAVGLDHAHIFGQISGLLDAGCDLVGLATDDPDAAVALSLVLVVVAVLIVLVTRGRASEGSL